MNDMNEKVQKVLTENGLDFRIEKLPLVGLRQVKFDDGSKSEVNVTTPYYGLLNTKSGNIINSVKEGYTVTQNDEVVELVMRGVQDFGQLSVQRAGSINDGRKIFLQLAIEGNGKVGNDTIKRYVTIVDSNDGSTGLSVGIGDLTMSCDNQFFAFYKAGQMKMRHTASIDAKLRELPMLIEGALAESMRMVGLYNDFQSTKVTRELSHGMVNHLLGYDRTSPVSVLSELKSRSTNAMDSLYANIENEMNSKGDNLWGLHSGVTRWTTHDKSAPRRDNGRLESLMLGTNYRTNQQSLAFAKQVLETA